MFKLDKNWPRWKAYHFQDVSRVKEHAKELQSWIVGNSSLCNEQLFVFDEAKRFPVGLLDSLSTFFDPGSPFAEKVRRSIFIFLYEGEEGIETPSWSSILQPYRAPPVR